MKKIVKYLGGLTEKHYFCQQKKLKLENMLDVKETLKKSEERMEMAAMFLEDELNRIRAGRANVAILDGVRVESYGSKVPLNQVANVSVPESQYSFNIFLNIIGISIFLFHIVK